MKCTARSKFVLSAAAAFVVLPSLARSATVTLTASDAVGTTSFNTNLHWSNGALPTAANDYVVGAGLTLRTPSSQATNIVFAGNSLSLTDTAAGQAILLIRNLTGTTTTVNNLTLDGGQIQNGGNGSNAATSVTLASNGITLGATAGGTFNALTAGSTLNINAPISGAGQLTLNAGNGLITLNAANTNTYLGNTTISGTAVSGGNVLGSVRALNGTNIPANSNLALASGVLETNVDITRLGGTGAGRIVLSGAAAGFSAVGGNATVAIGGLANPTPLTWGSGAFAQSVLVLNSSNATGRLNFTNPIDLSFATRTVFNTGTATSSATLSGGISSETASAGMNFYGGGVTILSTENAFTGAVTIGSSANSATTATSGVLRATASGALGTGVVTIGTGGGNTTGRLELSGGTTLFNAITVPTRNGTSVAVQNLGGNNTLTNTVAISSGGTYGIIQSDAGLLTLNGTAAGGNVAINSATGVRTATLQGVGNGVVSGAIANGSGTINVAKAGAGTWTLSNSGSSYTGTTTLIGGTLSTSSLANGGSNSGIGAATNAAANLVLAGGKLLYTGASTSTDRLFTIGAAGGTLDASGTGEVTFANTAAHLTVDPATNGTYSSGTNAVTVTAGAIAGLVVGQTVSGTGIPGGTTITGVNYNGTTFTLSANATAGGTGAALTIGATPTRTLTLTGSNTANNAINGALTNSATGKVLAVAKTGAGTWVLGGANTYAGATTVTDGVLRASVASGAAGNLLTNAGGIDLGDVAGKVILDYTGGVSPVASVKSILTGEYSSGGNSATGFLVGQLRSTTLTSTHTIGYGDNGLGFVTLRVTLPGDADLDGDVDFNDFLALQNNFSASNTRFDQGNFNYDGVTDFNDFLVIQNNFGQSMSISVPRPIIMADEVAAMAAFGQASAGVPEPAGLTLFGLSLLMLRRRYR